MQQNVLLLDELGELFGEKHEFYDLRSPAEAIKLLCINSREFTEYLLKAGERGIDFVVVQAGMSMGVEDLALPLGSNDLVLAPVIRGSGGVWKKAKKFLSSPVGRIITGIALITAAVVFAPASATVLGMKGMGVAGGFLGAGGAAVIGYMGVSMVLGGVSQLLTPTPEMPEVGNVSRHGDNITTRGATSFKRGLSGTQSYAYAGPANTVGTGHSVPVCYGKMLCGSNLVSVEVEPTDADDSSTLKSYVMEPSLDTMTVGGEKLEGNKWTDVSGIKTRRTTRTRFNDKDAKNVDRTIANVQNGTKVSIDASTMSTSYNKSKKFTIALSLREGLYDRVSGPGSTIVPGFITYRVEVWDKPKGGNDVVCGQIQTTVQGLITSAAKFDFIWLHQFSYSFMDTDNLSEVVVEIVDSRVTKGRLKVEAYGHDFLS